MRETDRRHSYEYICTAVLCAAVTLLKHDGNAKKARAFFALQERQCVVIVSIAFHNTVSQLTDKVHVLDSAPFRQP